MLWHFARDDLVSEAAKHVRLSLNTIQAIYAKLRRYFVETRLFVDFYEYQGDEKPDPRYEFDVLDLHLKRMARKHGARRVGLTHHQQFCESCYRFEMQRSLGGASADNLPRLIYEDMLQLIRIAGPVGGRKTDKLAAYKFLVARIDTMLLRMGRNAPGFKDEASRKLIKEVRDL